LRPGSPRNSVGSVRVPDKVRADPRGSGRARVVEFSLNYTRHPAATDARTSRPVERNTLSRTQHCVARPHRSESVCLCDRTFPPPTRTSASQEITIAHADIFVFIRRAGSNVNNTGWAEKRDHRLTTIIILSGVGGKYPRFVCPRSRRCIVRVSAAVYRSA